MTIEDAKRDITKHFLCRWKDVDGEPLTTVVLENEPITVGKEGEPWVRFSVDIFLFSADSMGVEGNRRVMRSGLMNIQIFVPLNEKTGRLNELSAKAIRLFEGKKFEGVFFRNPRTQTIEEESDSLWFGSLVTIPFDFVEII